MKAESVCRKGVDRGRTRIAVFGKVKVGKFALPDIAKMLAAGS